MKCTYNIVIYVMTYFLLLQSKKTKKIVYNCLEITKNVEIENKVFFISE